MREEACHRRSIGLYYLDTMSGLKIKLYARWDSVGGRSDKEPDGEEYYKMILPGSEIYIVVVLKFRTESQQYNYEHVNLHFCERSRADYFRAPIVARTML